MGFVIFLVIIVAVVIFAWLIKMNCESTDSASTKPAEVEPAEIEICSSEYLDLDSCYDSCSSDTAKDILRELCSNTSLDYSRIKGMSGLLAKFKVKNLITVTQTYIPARYDKYWFQESEGYYKIQIKVTEEGKAYLSN